MKRIAGIFNLDGAPVRSMEIHRMLAALNDHGNNKEAVWIEGNIGFGCTRIGNALCEKRDDMLSYNPQEGCVIAFDGRIDNRRELLTVLRPPSLERHSHISDEEIVLGAYEKWELDCPKHLIGDFAFAIWDGRKQCLICARDHFGVKPFYYSLCNRVFVFASNPHALLASGKVSAELNEARIADHLVDQLEGIDTTSTFYQSVVRLTPAHLLIVRPEGLMQQPYWQLTPKTHPEFKTEDEYVEAFRAVFAEAIRCRLTGPSLPGSMLSGGMDSSAIVGMARQVLAEEGLPPLSVFAVTSDIVTNNRETQSIHALIQQGQLQSHLISETELQWRMDELVKAVEEETEPFDCFMNLIRAVYLHAEDHAIHAVMDGISGDVLFPVVGHLPELWRQGAIRTILGETVYAGGVIAEHRMGRGFFRSSLISAFTPTAPGWYRQLRQPIRNAKFFRAAVHDTLIDRDFAVRACLSERLGKLYSHHPRLDLFNPVQRHKIVLEQPFITAGLERYERVASGFGIETLHPFYDIRLVEFCLGLPWQLQTHHGWTKVILRQALEPLLPTEVIWRRDKDSLMPEVNRLILKEKAEYFYQITLDEQANLKPYVDVGKLMKFWHEYRSLGDETHSVLIWSGIALALWLRRQRTMQSGLRWQ